MPPMTNRTARIHRRNAMRQYCPSALTGNGFRD